MKSLIPALAILILLWGATIGAAEKLLTEKQLDGITAGTSGENAQQTMHDNSVESRLDDVKVQKDLDFGDSDAKSIVNNANSFIDNSVDASQNVNSKNKKLELKDKAQENAKAVNILNSVDSRVGTGINVHVTPSSSSGGKFDSLHQINTIVNN